ncbi:uncharacterized protein ACRADG_010622 [Cochliomyia hominivorax]
MKLFMAILLLGSLAICFSWPLETEQLNTLAQVDAGGQGDALGDRLRLVRHRHGGFGRFGGGGFGRGGYGGGGYGGGGYGGGGFGGGYPGGYGGGGYGGVPGGYGGVPGGYGVPGGGVSQSSSLSQSQSINYGGYPGGAQSAAQSSASSSAGGFGK